MKNFIKFFLALFVINFINAPNDFEDEFFESEDTFLGREVFKNDAEYSEYLLSIISKKYYEEKNKVVVLTKDLVDTKIECKIWKENHDTLRKELDPLRTEHAVLKKDLAGWNKYKIGFFVGGTVACIAVTYVVIRIYNTLYRSTPQDDEIDKDIQELADSYEAWSENRRAEADEYTKSLYAEFDTATVRKAIREGSPPDGEFLKAWALYGGNILYMIERFGINIQDEEFMASFCNF